MHARCYHKGRGVSFDWGIEQYATSSRRVILVGDWNAVLDPSLDHGSSSSDANTLDAWHFCRFVERLDLVDKLCGKHPNKFERTWTGRGASVQYYSSLDRVLVKRIDLDTLGGTHSEAYKDSDHTIFSVSIKFDKAKRRISG